jgi:hypothetical protein
MSVAINGAPLYDDPVNGVYEIGTPAMRALFDLPNGAAALLFCVRESQDNLTVLDPSFAEERSNALIREYMTDKQLWLSRARYFLWVEARYER